MSKMHCELCGWHKSQGQQVQGTLDDLLWSAFPPHGRLSHSHLVHLAQVLLISLLAIHPAPFDGIFCQPQLLIQHDQITMRYKNWSIPHHAMLINIWGSDPSAFSLGMLLFHQSGLRMEVQTSQGHPQLLWWSMVPGPLQQCKMPLSVPC